MSATSSDTVPANPAQVLLDNFTAYNKACRGSSWLPTWYEVFNGAGPYSDSPDDDSRADEVRLELAILMQAVYQLKDIIDVLPSAGARGMFRTYSKEWSKALMPGQSGRAEPVQEGSIYALQMFSEAIANGLPARALDSNVDKAALAESAEALLRELEEDKSLDPKFKSLLKLRVGDVLWALRHVETVGVDGLETACARLATALRANDDAGGSTAPSHATALNLLANMWALIKVTDTLTGGLPAIGNAVDSITRGIGS